VDEVADAIRRLAVRGAPAIGVAAAYGLALEASCAPREREGFLRHLEGQARLLASTRPTAVNLFWAIGRMRGAASAAADLSPPDRAARLAAEARAIEDEDRAMCLAIGRLGAPLLRDGDGVMTHCNAGALATLGIGTALGVIRTAWAAGVRFRVYARETRPLLQGARLTAWELLRDGIDTTLVTDSMAAHMMARGMVQRVLVGADRIAANGDTANKIGTYGLAIAARHHGIPFHVAAPASTVDRSVAGGDGIPIEERSPEEITTLAGIAIAARGTPAYNPAFDVTPAELITSIITDRGIAEPPYGAALERLLGADR
jgi:methylthioribose-1-phosphate isomerase